MATSTLDRGKHCATAAAQPRAPHPVEAVLHYRVGDHPAERLSVWLLELQQTTERGTPCPLILPGGGDTTTPPQGFGIGLDLFFVCVDGLICRTDPCGVHHVA
jgi:hypothetical protein